MGLDIALRHVDAYRPVAGYPVKDESQSNLGLLLRAYKNVNYTWVSGKLAHLLLGVDESLSFGHGLGLVSPVFLPVENRSEKHGRQLAWLSAKFNITYCHDLLLF